MVLRRVDTKTGEQTVWGRNGYKLGAPLFIPSEYDQGPDSEQGAVLVVGVDGAGAVVLFVVDAATMVLVAELALPMRPIPSVGLHNHYSSLVTSA